MSDRRESLLNSPDRGSVREAVHARVAARRERHRRRPLAVRVLVAAAGGLLTVAGALLIWAPELGLPLLLGGLGLLALEFEWATGAQAWTEWRAVQARHWFGRQPRAVKVGVPLILAAAVLLVLWFFL